MMNDDPPGLYLHIPFCITRCLYCDFYSDTRISMAGRFLECLAREDAPLGMEFSAFDTVYIGGGTPSAMPAGSIARLMERIGGRFETATGAEVTIEVNPDDVAAGKLAEYRGAGINRISVGIQSFDDGELKFLGRRHDARSAMNAARAIREAGMENLGIDLIFGFAGHTTQSWRSTLETALSLGPEHVSCYQMTIEGPTPMARMLAAGRIEETGEELQRELFLLASATLKDHGYIHYEISNYARGEGAMSRHNGKYWAHAPYLGLGPSAHSFAGSERWWNLPSIEGYCGGVEEGKGPPRGSERLTARQLDIETLYLGLRTARGLPLEFLSRFPAWERALERLEDDSCLRVEGGRIVPTTKGFLFADSIPSFFL